MSADTSFTLNRLLAWLDRDPREAGKKYVYFHQELMAYVKRRGKYADPEEIADEALDRVDKRLATSLLNEHHNSKEISDALSLCRIFHEWGPQNSPSPSRRIWQLLSPSSQTLVTDIASAGTFESKQRSILSHDLNEILRRRDFYSEDDFAQVISKTKSVNNPLREKIEAGLTRGLAQLSQDEIERFNRRLLEASYPTMIKINLGDTPDEDKLSRCKHFVLIVLLERSKEPRGVEALTPVWTPEPEVADEQQQMLACLEECKRLKLSPRDQVVLEKYFTGIQIRSSEDEPLSDAEITAVRKSLAEELGVAPETIRTIAHRSKEIVLRCLERCLKRAEKK